jgi:hypothetical protein
MKATQQRLNIGFYYSILICLFLDNLKGLSAHVKKTLWICGYQAREREVYCHQRNLNWTVSFIFYESVKTSAADILHML